MANFQFNGYDNFIIEDQIKSYLNTKLSLSRFLTVDNSLVGTDGLKAVIHKYVGSGSAEDLARGDSNSADIDANYVSAEYTASRHQARTRYYDDDAFNDSTWVDSKIRFCGEAMVNDYNNKAIAEFAKTNNVCEISAFNFDGFADAVGKYAQVHEVEDGLMFLVDIKLIPAIRKALKETLQYVEAYARQGSIGSICGVPIFASKIVPDGLGFLVNAEAVKDFVKSDVRVEQTRNVDSKENTIVIDRYDIIALVDESKCVAVGKGQATPVTITTYTKNATALAGAGTDGAKVTCYVNGKKTGSASTVATGAWAVTADANLVAGDVVMAVAELDGFVKSIATVTVAE